ncbi:MAG: LysR family transcriptional regulator [Methylobacteriaceae bacterium]|nr:LysR family transcriptional regulator [Methylobacteriaceae bacterium]
MKGKLDALRVLVAAVEGGSLAAGGRATGLTRDQASKLVAQLEADLGTRLIERSTRSLSLTPGGAAYLDGVRGAVAALDEAERSLRARATAVRGPLRVNAPLAFGMLKLAPLVPDFLRLHPGISLDLKLDDSLLDQVGPDCDLLLRIAARPLGELAATRICTVLRSLCAAPAYLADAAPPTRPADLASHACLHYGNLASGAQWVFQKGRTTAHVPIRGPLASNNGFVLATAAAAGHGLAILPGFLADPLVAEGRLVRVMTDWAVPAIHVFAMASPVHQRDGRVGALQRFLLERLRPE